MTNAAAMKLPATQRLLLREFGKGSRLCVMYNRTGSATSAAIRSPVGFHETTVAAVKALVDARAIVAFSFTERSTCYRYTRMGALMRAAVIRTTR